MVYKSNNEKNPPIPSATANGIGGFYVLGWYFCDESIEPHQWIKLCKIKNVASRIKVVHS